MLVGSGFGVELPTTLTVDYEPGGAAGYEPGGASRAAGVPAKRHTSFWRAGSRQRSKVTKRLSKPGVSCFVALGYCTGSSAPARAGCNGPRLAPLNRLAGIRTVGLPTGTCSAFAWGGRAARNGALHTARGPGSRHRRYHEKVGAARCTSRW